MNKRPLEILQAVLIGVSVAVAYAVVHNWFGR